MPQDWIIEPDIAKAWTLPSSFYHDPEVYRLSTDKIFARSWQFAAQADVVKVPGSVYPFTLLEGSLDEPLLFTRDRDDQIHCLSNVCTHRGNLVCEGVGNSNSLRCRYHGRRFGLDGSFQSMPEFEGVKDFPQPSDSLPHVNFGQWRQFLFVNLGKGNINEMFAELESRIGWMPIEQFTPRPELGKEYLVQGNWALYVDNYLEGFHIPYIHNALNATLDYGTYRTELLQAGNLQLGTAADGEEVFDLPSSSPDHGNRIAAYYYWLYPNLMLNFYPWGLSINIVKPLGPTKTKVIFLPFVWDESKLGSGAGAALDRVEREDEAVVEMTQKGVRSRFYNRGRYAVEREKGVHQFHQMITRDMLR